MKPLLTVLALFCAGPALAQRLETPLGGNLIQVGLPAVQFFDLRAQTALSVTELEVNLQPGRVAPGQPLPTQATLNVYIRPGSFVGNTGSFNGWTLAGSVVQPNLPQPIGGLTPFRFATPIDLNPGVWAVALECVEVPVVLTPGLVVGTPIASNADLTLFSGVLGDPGGGTTSGAAHFNGAVSYQVRPGFAAANPFGAGCGKVATYASFYEQFPTSTIDLAGSAGSEQVLQLLFTGGGYAVIPAAPAWDTPGPTATPVAAPTATGSVPATVLPFQFPYPGGTTDRVWIDTELCVIYLQDPASNVPPVSFPAPLNDYFLGGAPVFAPLATIYGSGGAVSYEVDPSGTTVHITFANVVGPLLGTPSTFQCALSASGAVEYRYRELSPSTLFGPPIFPTVGYFAGAGSLDPGSRDVSAGAFATGPDLELEALDLDADRPVEGASIQLTVSNVDPDAVFGALIFSGTQVLPGVPAISPGAPGCLRFVGIDEVFYFGPNVPSVAIPAVVPTGSFTGQSVFVQAVTLIDGPVRSTVTTSNGLELRIDAN